MFSNCELLVSSTDTFLPEARITIAQLKRLGLADLFKCYLLLGETSVDITGFTVLHRRKRGTWSSELREGLEQMSADYVLLCLDDLVPIEADVPRIRELIGQFIDHGGSYLRLNPRPPANAPSEIKGANTVQPGELYRTSTIWSVWRRVALLSLLRPDESAWQFELVGASRSDRLGGFFASDTALVKFVNLVVKGVVDPRAERVLKRAGIDTTSLPRRRMTNKELLVLSLKEFRARLLRLVPAKVRRGVRERFETDLPTK